MHRTRRQPTVAPTATRCAVRTSANDNARDPWGNFALRAVAAWGGTFSGPFARPSRAAVNAANARAITRCGIAQSNPSAANRAAAARAFNELSAALLAWCTAAAVGPYDAHAIGPSVLAGCDAGAACDDAAKMIAPRVAAVG